jgi:hypothetical protein
MQLSNCRWDKDKWRINARCLTWKPHCAMQSIVQRLGGTMGSMYRDDVLDCPRSIFCHLTDRNNWPFAIFITYPLSRLNHTVIRRNSIFYSERVYSQQPWVPQYKLVCWWCYGLLKCIHYTLKSLHDQFQRLAFFYRECGHIYFLLFQFFFKIFYLCYQSMFFSE